MKSGNLSIIEYDAYHPVLLAAGRPPSPQASSEPNPELCARSAYEPRRRRHPGVFMQQDSKLEGNPNPNALLTAAKHGDCARVTALLQGPHTAFVNFAGVRGDTALHLGASQGHADVVQALVGHGGDPRQLNDAGETALHKACLNRHAKVVQLLLQHPKNPVDARRKVDGRSALMLAASAGDASLVNLLLESKAYVNAADARGLTALHLACASGSCDAVMALCEARANCNSVSSEGKTAEDYAAGNKAVLAVLADWTELS
ncbi:hypothetical protein QJQ45_002853 [Haematococcus lacustris]|nr:hypothetical protein QJQ45_002853 [Haematococcus lacustris]